MENAERFAGSLDEWEKVLGVLASSLADLADCQIPLRMLRAAVTLHEDGRRKEAPEPAARTAPIAAGRASTSGRSDRQYC